jgi:hypothetical protein
METPWFEFLLSIFILCMLINYREVITPDFIHFVTCMVDEEAHFICVMGYWLFWKCFLMPDPMVEKMSDSAQKVENRTKTVARAFIEMNICLGANYMTFESGFPWIYCYSVFAFAALRSIYFEYMDLTSTLFVALYCC